MGGGVYLRRQPPEFDKAYGGVVVKGVFHRICGQAPLVQAVIGPAPHNGLAAFVEFYPDLAGDMMLCLLYEGLQRRGQWREPQAVVDHLREPLIDDGFELRDVPGQGEVFQLLVGVDQDHGGGVFINLS